MRVTILTFGLTVLTMGVLGYPLPRIGDERRMLDAESKLVRRQIEPGTPGYGIGVSAGSVDPIPAGSGGPGGSNPVAPVNSAPVNPQPVAPELVTPEPVSPGTVTPGTVTPGTVTPGTVTPETVTPGTTDPEIPTAGSATDGSSPVVPNPPVIQQICPSPLRRRDGLC
ncbi:hypothetical protein MMC22_011748 [Lobaria immixta]|nr:hypothetical protein [Lobaria immixta]